MQRTRVSKCVGCPSCRSCGKGRFSGWSARVKKEGVKIPLVGAEVECGVMWCAAT